MAEAIFKDRVVRAGLSDHFFIDSVGTGDYHVGDRAHRGTRQILAEYGLNSDSIARQINGLDISQADYLIAMDSANQAEVLALARQVANPPPVDLLLKFAEDPPVIDVPDPYFTGDFAETYELVSAGCAGLLAYIRERHGL